MGFAASQGTGPRSGTDSWYQPSAVPLARNASHCSSSLLRSLGAVKSSILRQGTSSRGLDKPKPIKARFKPVRLADWSEDREPKACRN